MSQNDPYLAVLDELRDLTMKKRAGYAPGADPFANFRMTQMFSLPCEECGHATPIPPIFGIMIREMDKMARIASLLAKPSNDQVGETIRETMMDAGNYPLIGVAYMDEEKSNDLPLDERSQKILAEIEAERNARYDLVFDSRDMEPPEDECCLSNCGCLTPCLDCQPGCGCRTL